jgi:hypothetical protein
MRHDPSHVDKNPLLHLVSAFRLMKIQTGQISANEVSGDSMKVIDGGTHKNDSVPYRNFRALVDDITLYICAIVNKASRPWKEMQQLDEPYQ